MAAIELGLAALLGLAAAQLSFATARDAQRFGADSFGFSLASFSRPVYGKRYPARLQREASNGCVVAKSRWQITDAELPPAALVLPGECGLRAKIINAQLGGSLFCVVALPAGYDPHWQAALASAGGLDLPVVLIGEAQGARLQEMLREGDVPLRLEVPAEQSDAVSMQFVLRPGDEGALALLESLQPYLDQFDARLTLKFAFYRAGPDDAETPKLQGIANCLRRDKAITALLAHKRNCLAANVTAADCLQSQVELREQRALEVCLRGAPRAEAPATDDAPEPQILINGFYYAGAWQPDELFAAVCAAFFSSPDNCLYINNRFVANLDYTNFRAGGEVDKYLVVLAICVVELALLFMVGLLFAIVYSRIYGGVVYERVPGIVKDSMLGQRSFSREASRHEV